MKKRPQASARITGDALRIASAQSAIKAIVGDHVRRKRPAKELEKRCAPIISQLIKDAPNDEMRSAIAESMDRYVRELLTSFATLFFAVDAASRVLSQQKVYTAKKTPYSRGEIPVSTNPLAYNMSAAARENFEVYQKQVRVELDRILRTEPRRYDGNINLRTIAELNVRYEKQMRMVDNLAEQGKDLVWIEPHANCSKRCEPWQGKLYSISGLSGRTKDGVPFQPLSNATDVYVTTKKGTTYKNGCITGFGCRHKLLPHAPGLRPQMIPAEVVEKQREAEARQRYLERRIRYEKERAEILSAIDPEEARISRNRAAGLTKYYEKFSRDSSLGAVPTRLRTVSGENIYTRNVSAKDRKKYGI